jgi:ATP-dependent Lhr-like helicase
VYLARGGRPALTFTADDLELAAAARALAATIRGRALGRLTVTRIDGEEVLADGALHGPLGRALVEAGFTPTPRGLRLTGRA